MATSKLSYKINNLCKNQAILNLKRNSIGNVRSMSENSRRGSSKDKEIYNLNVSNNTKLNQNHLRENNLYKGSKIQI